MPGTGIGFVCPFRRCGCRCLCLVVNTVVRSGLGLAVAGFPSTIGAFAFHVFSPPCVTPKALKSFRRSPGIHRGMLRISEPHVILKVSRSYPFCSPAGNRKNDAACVGGPYPIRCAHPYNQEAVREKADLLRTSLLVRVVICRYVFYLTSVTTIATEHDLVHVVSHGDWSGIMFIHACDKGLFF